MVCTGLNEVIGSWKIIEMSLRRIDFMVSLSRASSVMVTVPPAAW